MNLDVLHVDFAGGGPGLVVLRVAGRAFSEQPCRLAPPALLIADGGAWRRLATIAGTPPIAAGPDAPTFMVDVEVPLHLATGEGPWWLEPGPVLAEPGDGRGGLDHAALAALRARLSALGAEVAALRVRVEAEERIRTAAAATPSPPVAAAPSPTAVPLPRPRLRLPRPTLPALLFAAGALAVGDAAATVLWTEPLSALWAGHQQHELQSDLANLDHDLAAKAPTAISSLPPNPEVRMRALARTLERTTDSGHPLGEIRIPRIGAKYVVVQGTGASSLSRGPGHYLGTPLPGQVGTVGIAGHRTTYGAPFRHLDALKPGDPIDVTMPYGRFVYRVEGLRVVKPQDVSALRDIGRQRLVLTACHPLYSAAKRLLVIARLDRSAPRGAAQTAAPATPPARPAGGAAAARPQRA